MERIEKERAFKWFIEIHLIQYGQPYFFAMRKSKRGSADYGVLIE